MNPTLPDALAQAAPHIQASLERSNPDGNTLADVMDAILGGEARLWAGNNAAAVTQFIQSAVIKGDEIVWHAGAGDMIDLLNVLEWGALACKQVGCDRLIIEETRPGWERVLEAQGFRKVTVLVKEL